MTYQTPTDAHVKQASIRGHEKSRFAQARWGRKPVTLKQAPPWEKDEAKQEGEE